MARKGDFHCKFGPGIFCQIDFFTGSDEVPTLVGYFGGRQAVQWAAQGQDVLKAVILENLATLFGGTWAKEPCDILIKVGVIVRNQ